MAETLLSNEFLIPAPRSEQDSRPRLIEKLIVCLHLKLTLIFAPIYFGG